MWRNFLVPYQKRIDKASVNNQAVRLVHWRAILLGVQFIVSRSLLHFERIEAPPGALTAEVLKSVELIAMARSPFDDPGLHLVWGVNGVSAWSWSWAELKKRGVPENAWILPETCAEDLSSPGIHIRPRWDGWEAVNVGGDGEVELSRFWERQPNESDLSMFRRSTDRDWSPATPREALGALDRIRLLIRSRLSPLNAAISLSALLAIPFGLLLGSVVILSSMQMHLNSDIEQFNSASDGSLASLRAYQGINEKITAIDLALSPVQPLISVAELAEVVAELNGRVVNFESGRGQLTAHLDMPREVAPARIVQELEQRATLSEVTIERQTNRDRWIVRATASQRPSGENP